ncbi:SDR family NAD(P)-dependent oxidoreductase [Tsukamurella soli]|uniref:SDR family NAD(P)-dependent oxidoreductase n=2 Tax=Tsukamurella soli TaxID=644556 RepID=A0ABP8KD85_9ACTN
MVTGAGAGIGRAVALAYARQGATVTVADIDDAAGGRTVAQIEAAGGAADYVHANVSSSADCDALVAAVVARHGRLDIACNNAGVAPPTTPLAEVTDEQWRRVTAVDLDGVFFCARAEIRAMAAAGGGVIINIASTLGQVAFPGLTPYTAAKHGVVGITKQIALEYAAAGIRAIAVGPAFIRTGLENGIDPAARAHLDELHPIGRMGEPEEVGDLVALLSGPATTFVNGAYLPVDGGYLTR